MTNYEYYKDDILARAKKRNIPIRQAVVDTYCQVKGVNSVFKDEYISWLFEEYIEKVQPLIKLSQLEADILEAFVSMELEEEYDSLYFNEYYHLAKLKDMGWFKGIEVNMTLQNIVKNVTVV